MSIYTGLSADLIAQLLPLETRATGFPRHDEESIEDVYARLGVPFTADAARFYARLAARPGHTAVVAHWYKRVGELSGDWGPYRQHCTRVGWLSQVLDSFDDEAVGAKQVLPLLRERLRHPSGDGRGFRVDKRDLELAERLAPYDSRILKRTARVLIPISIKRRNRDLMNHCLETVGRSLTKTEARLYLRELLRRMSHSVIKNCDSAPEFVASEIMRLELADEFAPRLRKALTTRSFRRDTIEDVERTLGTPMGEAELLELRKTQMEDVLSYGMVETSEALVRLNEDYEPLLNKALNTAANRALGWMRVRLAQEYALRLGQGLLPEELRRVLARLDQQRREDNWHHYAPEEAFALQLLAQGLSEAA